MNNALDALMDVFRWLGNNPHVLFWIFLPAGLIAVWACLKIISLWMMGRADTNTIAELERFQVEYKNTHPNQTIVGYTDILGKRPNAMAVLLYKYVLSHENFANIVSHFSQPEYQKVARTTKSHGGWNGLLWIFHIPIVLFLLVGVAASFGYNTYAIDALLFPMVVALFYILTLALLFVYQTMLRRYKENLLGTLHGSAAEFFSPLDEHFSEFSVSVIRVLNPSETMRRRIKKMLVREGLVFRQLHHDRAEGTAVSEEDLEEYTEVVVPNNETNIEDIFKNFESVAMPANLPNLLLQQEPPPQPPPPPPPKAKKVIVAKSTLTSASK